ncbi:MAG: hypothetical protein WC044_11030 [Crocinitomicaceae bacterium]
MKRFFGLFILVLLFSAPAYGQKQLIVSVLDSKSDLPIPGVTISLSQVKIVFIGKTDSVGMIQTPFSVNGKINLFANHPNYYSFERQFNMQDDTLKLVIRLRPENIQIIKEVVVKAPGAVDTVFSSSRLHVEDFEVLKNGNMVLLTYPKRLKSGSEVLLYDGQSILQSLSVPDQAERLEKDYRGNVHVICKDRVITLLTEGNVLKIAQLDRPYFYRYIAPILDTNGENLYYSDFNKNYPEFSYWKFDQEDTLYEKFRTVRDDLMMELYRSEYKWVDVRTKLWAKNLEFETGIDAEIWVGANYFTQSVYYKELYAPFFKVNDELLVFDYYRNELFFHDTLGLALGSSDIHHHLDKKTTGWKSAILQDPVNDNLYGWYEKSGTSYLGKIDTKTGEVIAKYQLNFKYLEKIEVNDDFVYYVYRPFESQQKKYVYRERLPDTFTETH